jgi:hypothetical protein
MLKVKLNWVDLTQDRKDHRTEKNANKQSQHTVTPEDHFKVPRPHSTFTTGKCRQDNAGEQTTRVETNR